MNVEVNESDPAEAPPSRPSRGFRAHLQGVNLHDLIQVENLARSSGVFVVLSGDRVGYLHMLHGELIHAEAEGVSGEQAALEILSWHEGEFRNCERSLAPVPTVRASLQALLLRLAKEADEAARHSDSSSLASSGTRRRDNGRLVTERPSVASRATRLSADGISRAEVLLNERGELLDGRGHAYDEFASEVAYAARLAELIGQSLGAGEIKAVGVHGKANELLIRRLPNANILGIVRAAKGTERAEGSEGAARHERLLEAEVSPASPAAAAPEAVLSAAAVSPVVTPGTVSSGASPAAAPHADTLSSAGAPPAADVSGESPGAGPPTPRFF